MGNGGLWKLWTSTDGRISRRTYWMRVAFPFMGLSLIVTGVENGLQTGLGMDYGAGPLTLLWGILATWPLLATSVKRAHDMGRPARDLVRWLVAAVVVSLLALLLQPAASVVFGGFVILTVMVVTLALATWAVRVAFFRGTVGPNKYGPDPVR